MSKLLDLTEFIINLNLVKRNSVIAYQDEIDIKKILFSRDPDNESQLIAYEGLFDCEIEINGYPHDRHPKQLLVTHVACWLLEKDLDRSHSLKFTVEEEKGKALNTTDFIISIQFEDKVLIKENTNGQIIFQNKKYSLLESS